MALIIRRMVTDFAGMKAMGVPQFTDKTEIVVPPMPTPLSVFHEERHPTTPPDTVGRSREVPVEIVNYIFGTFDFSLSLFALCIPCRRGSHYSGMSEQV